MATAASTATSTVGPLLRDWRQRRRLSQLDVSARAAISTRHLSFLETGRARPSREMVLHLAEELDVPLRERNTLLVAAGYAPVYQETPLEGDDMATVRQTLQQLLTSHEPNPALVVDRQWNLVLANRAVGLLMAGVPESLLVPPVNVLRVSLHPDGLAPRIANFEEWSGHLLSRLGREVTATGDPSLAALYDELRAFPGVSDRELAVPHGDGAGRLMVTLRLKSPMGDLAFFSTVATFGTAVDITLAELSIESFFPADTATAATLRAALTT
ncbi:MAG TPA: helix-turn-helix transcriptional regulator, partial [Acidimicrobiia bacterium]|nr:helix-turn-helix transcriptional regulator [Acidimicrobiia bacterium]